MEKLIGEGSAENSSKRYSNSLRKRRRDDDDSLRSSSLPKNCSSNGPCILPLQPVPSVEEWGSSASVILSGTACEGRTGPPVGAMDIGISESAYCFLIALPGVKKDPGEFSCEIHRDGKVNIRGVTSTGQKSVSRCSRVFEMKLQQQCPPGPFTLSFSLPGAVDPRMVLLDFRTDGILEAIVMKNE